MVEVGYGDLLIRRVKISVVGQTVVLPDIGILVPGIVGTDGRIDKDPASVYIGFDPPVISDADVVLCSPVVQRRGNAMAVDESGRYTLGPGQRQEDGGKSLTGSGYPALIIAVFTGDLVYVAV